MRGGHIVEERVPVDVFLDDELRYTEEPRNMSRKDSEYGKRPKAKPTEEKKKSRAPSTSYRAAKDVRESVKATQADKAKQRDRDRKRQASAKYEEVYEPFSPRVVSDPSDLSDSDTYVPPRRPAASRRTTRESRESREPRERESRSRPTESSRRRERIYEDDDDYSDRYASNKHDGWQTLAEQHIERSKYEILRSSRSPPRPRGYDSTEPESSASRRSGRTSRSTRDQSSSRNNSYEHLESSRSYDFKPPKIPTTATSPGHKASIRPSLFTRAATAGATGFTRKREGSGREEPSLEKMAREQVREPREPIPSRSSKRYDSGYSSPSTPEMPQRGASPKTTTTRYKIDDPVVIEPSSKSKYRSVSPERPRGPPKRSSTYQYKSEASPRIEVRTVRPSRPHGDVEYSPRIRGEDIMYTREIRPGDVNRSSPYADQYPRHPPARRQSAYA
jgi:hypothetical protein